MTEVKVGQVWKSKVGDNHWRVMVVNGLEVQLERFTMKGYPATSWGGTLDQLRERFELQPVVKQQFPVKVGQRWLDPLSQLTWDVESITDDLVWLRTDAEGEDMRRLQVFTQTLHKLFGLVGTKSLVSEYIIKVESTRRKPQMIDVEHIFSGLMRPQALRLVEISVSNTDGPVCPQCAKPVFTDGKTFLDCKSNEAGSEYLHALNNLKPWCGRRHAHPPENMTVYCSDCKGYHCAKYINSGGRCLTCGILLHEHDRVQTQRIVDLQQADKSLVKLLARTGAMPEEWQTMLYEAYSVGFSTSAEVSKLTKEQLMIKLEEKA